MTHPIVPAVKQARRLNLTFSNADTLRDIRDQALADNKTPSEFVERWMNFALHGEYSVDGERKRLVDQQVRKYLGMELPAPTTPWDLAKHRLTTLLVEALGPRHPALEDLAVLLLADKPQRKQPDEVLQLGNKMVDIPLRRVPALEQADSPLNAHDSTRPVTGRIVAAAEVEAVKEHVAELKAEAPLQSTSISEGAEYAGDYSEFFYDLGKLMGIGAQNMSPEQVWKTQMRPELAKMLGMTCEDEGCPHYGTAHAHATKDAAVFEMGEDANDNVMSILREIQGHYTRDDDLPNDLLPRIDRVLKADLTVIETEKLDNLYGKANVRDQMWEIVKKERPDLAGGTNVITGILREALQGTLIGTPKETRVAPDASLEARFHRALVRTGEFGKKMQGYIMGAYREAVEEHVREIPDQRNGAIFRHHTTGGRYKKLSEALLQSNVPLDDTARLVVYEGTDGQWWARPIREWDMKFKPEGHVTPAKSADPRDATGNVWEPRVNETPRLEAAPAREPMTHELKAHKEAFEAALLNTKKAEVRLDDRGYIVGDRMLLCEYDPVSATFTGRNIERFITHVQRGYGLKPGHVALSMMDAKTKRDEATPDYEKYLRELLAIIHRDGGHHTAKVGVDASFVKAICDIAADRVILEGKRLQDFDKMWATFSKQRGMLYGEDALSGVRVGYEMVQEAIQTAYGSIPVHHPIRHPERLVFRHLGFLASNADETEFMAWGDSGPEWTADRSRALRFARRNDVEVVVADCEKAWKILTASPEELAEFRQALGEKLSEVLDSMDEDKVMDWPNAGNVDVVIDFILPTITGSLTE